MKNKKSKHLKYIKTIENIRGKNNKNWMNLLRLAFKNKTKNTKKIVKKFSNLIRKLIQQ